MRNSYPGLSSSVHSLPPFAIELHSVYDLRARRRIAVQTVPRGAGGESVGVLARAVSPLLLPALYQKMMFESIRRSHDAGMPEPETLLLIRLPFVLAPEQVSRAFPAHVAIAAGLRPVDVLLELEPASLLTCEAIARVGQEELAAAALSNLSKLPFLPALAAGFSMVVKLDASVAAGLCDLPPIRRALAKFSQICQFSGVTPIAEGVASAAACVELMEAGVNAMQGPLFAQGIPSSFAPPASECRPASAA